MFFLLGVVVDPWIKVKLVAVTGKTSKEGMMFFCQICACVCINGLELGVVVGLQSVAKWVASSACTPRTQAPIHQSPSKKQKVLNKNFYLNFALAY